MDSTDTDVEVFDSKNTGGVLVDFMGEAQLLVVAVVRLHNCAPHRNPPWRFRPWTRSHAPSPTRLRAAAFTNARTTSHPTIALPAMDDTKRPLAHLTPCGRLHKRAREESPLAPTQPFHHTLTPETQIHHTDEEILPPTLLADERPTAFQMCRRLAACNTR